MENEILTMIQTPMEHETRRDLRSVHLLAKEYELLKDFTIPVGITNEDLEIEGLEPERAKKISIDGAQGKGRLNLYVFRPANFKDGQKTPVIYYIHGGGYQFGNTAAWDESLQDKANDSHATVVSVDYTLTKDPSYQHSMELEDAYAGLLYVYEHADELNVDKDNIILEGDSAGGGLCARLALYNRDRGSVPLKGQVLIYPMLDYRTGGKEDIYHDEYAGEFVWTRENNISGWTDLMAGQEKKPTDEELIYFSPATATVGQLKGLPETFIIVGSLDLFCEEDIDYARKLIQAGVLTELHVEPGVPHAYDVLDGTPQTARFSKLRDNAVMRMLGNKKDVNASDKKTAFGDIIKYIFGQ